VTPPSHKRDHLRALARLCRQLGGRLSIVSYRAYDDLSVDTFVGAFHVAPFTDAHGLHWSRKIVYVVRGREEIGSIIHEMGHVFADQHHPEHHKCCEWSWFGWEVAVARQIGAGRTWSRQNGLYVTGDEWGGAWCHLSVKQRRAVIADRLAHARKIGVLATDGAPRSVR
jgi:hypothetical protein